MIEVSHLSKSYGSRPAVQDLSFTVPDGQIYGMEEARILPNVLPPATSLWFTKRWHGNIIWFFMIKIRKRYMQDR